MIFEGEFLNGQIWSGKGNEEDTINELIYNGEYLNGQITGKGKLYWSPIEIIFEGEFLNGKRWNGWGGEF